MIWKFFYDTIMGIKTPKRKGHIMKNLLLGSLSLAAILAFSGCGGSEPKSIEELQKLSQDELKKMGEACKAIEAPAAFKLLSKNPNLAFTGGSDLEKAVESDSKLEKEREKIANDILQARGEKPKHYDAYTGATLALVVRDFTNEEISKFGNSDFAEYVECARLKKVALGL